ncbi:hypothetical protein Lal_00002165 [Lupinus albus]|nr:hypothetical protein Lal_00002165 [Lupinus albus]
MPCRPAEPRRSAPSLLISLRKDLAVFSYDDLVERVRYIGVKDGVGSVRLVIVSLKVFLPLSLKERLVNNFESLLLHGNEDFREQILNREEKRGKSQ